MSAMVIVRREASLDAENAAHWYETQLAGLGDKFPNALDRAIASIAENPNRYPIYYHAVQRCHVRRFPYAIFFAWDGKNVAVLAVFHMHRDPRLIHRILRQR